MFSSHWSAAAVLAAFASPLVAQDAQRIEALEKRVAELESKKGPTGSDTMSWNDFSLLGSRFQLYGFLRLDAYYDDSRPNSTTLPSFIRSEDQTAPATVRAPANENDFTMNLKLTRLGLNFTGPKVSGFGDPGVVGKLETDFYNATATDSREALRIRVAYLQLKWTNFNFYAGQMWDLISPLQPIVNNDNVMWNAGNLGDRRPQIRGEWFEGETTKFFLQGMLGNTGAIDGKDNDPANTTGSGFKDGDQSGEPTYQARAAISTPISDWKKPLEFGLWAHRAKEQTDVAVGNSTHFNSSAYGFDLQLPIYSDLAWFKLELWTGRDLGDVRGGILQSINANGKEIRSQGGFAEVGYKATDHVNVYAGYAFDDPNNDDLPATNASRTANTIWYAAVRCDFKPISLGLDYLRWETRFFGASDGTDNRLQAFIAYNF